MKPLIAGAALALSFSTSAFAVVVATNGNYDPIGGTGDADSSATASPNDIATFKTDVLAAFNAGFGGVIHFDLGADTPGSTLEATYGSKTLNISTNPGFNVQAISSGTALSGRALLLVTNAASADDGSTLTIGSITGGAANEAVTQLAFTMLSRLATGYPLDLTVTAFFSDGSSSVATSNIGNVAGTDDTFFAFTAPANHSITSIVLNPTNDASDARPVIDDLAFITSIIPEPSSAMLLGGTLGFMAFFRRRKS